MIQHILFLCYYIRRFDITKNVCRVYVLDVYFSSELRRCPNYYDVIYVEYKSYTNVFRIGMWLCVCIIQLCFQLTQRIKSDVISLSFCSCHYICKSRSNFAFFFVL